MPIEYAVAAFFGGWCGNVPLSEILRWILPGKNPPPPSGPFPIDWFLSKVLGAVGGVAAAYVYWGTFGPQPEPWGGVLGAMVFSFIGFLGGRFVSELYGVARNSRSLNRERS